MSESVIFPSDREIPEAVVKRLNEFLGSFRPYEITNGSKLSLYLDEKSEAFYVTCHLEGRILSHFCDIEASLEGEEEDEIYKLNREITEDQAAYKVMEKDALKGRSFEDMVLEYDTSYRPKKSLKV